jgi:hypothetical protein
MWRRRSAPRGRTTSTAAVTSSSTTTRTAIRLAVASSALDTPVS